MLYYNWWFIVGELELETTYVSKSQDIELEVTHL